MIGLFPSLMAADQLHLKAAIEKLEPFCDGFHLDIMDFHFVNNLFGGPAWANAIMRATKKPLQLHLMVEKPLQLLSSFTQRPGDMVILHHESVAKNVLQDIISDLKKRGWLVGIALKPATPISVLESVARDVDHLLVMAVEPGFSGQAFLAIAYDKVKQLVELREKLKAAYKIGVDGGIGLPEAQKLKKLGADTLAIGSAIFNAPQPESVAKNLREVL